MGGGRARKKQRLEKCPKTKKKKKKQKKGAKGDLENTKTHPKKHPEKSSFWG